MKKNSDFTYEIVETLGVVPSKTNMAIELNLIKWGDRRPTYDMRRWDDTHEMMGKGFTLTKDEIIELRDILNDLDF